MGRTQTYVNNAKNMCLSGLTFFCQIYTSYKIIYNVILYLRTGLESMKFKAAGMFTFEPAGLLNPTTFPSRFIKRSLQ